MKRKLLAVILTLAMLVSMVAATGLMAGFGAAASTGFVAGDRGQYKTLGKLADLNTEMGGKESLIKGMIPGNGGFSSYYRDYNESFGLLGQSTLKAVTDGTAGDATANARFVLATSVAKLYFDIGYKADITDFIISASQHDAISRSINQNTAIYVGDSVDTLLDEGNKVWAHVFAKGEQTADHYSLRIQAAGGATVTGRYVAFVITLPAEADQAADWYGQLRINELAVYGAPAEGVEFRVTPVLDKSQLPEAATQLNKGVMPYRWDCAMGVNITNGNSSLKYTLTESPNSYADCTATGTAAVLTDGEVLLDRGSYVTSSSPTNGQGLDNVLIPYAVADGEDTYYEWFHNNRSDAVAQSNASKAWRGYTTSDDVKYMFFDLGGVQQIEELLLGTYRALPVFTGTAASLTNANPAVSPSADALQARYINSCDKDSLIRNISVYVSNSLTDLFGQVSVNDLGNGSAGTLGVDANTNLVCTVGTNTSTVSRVTLDKAVTGRYVGILVDAKGQGGTLSELGVYGKKLVDTTQLSTSNADKVPSYNLLASSAKKAGNTNNSSGPVAHLYDGKVPGVNVAYDAEAAKDPSTNQIVSFFGTEQTVTTVDGRTVPKTFGLSTLTFQLTQPFTIDRVLVAGSVNDSTAFVDKGITYDNRHVLYYEVYVGDSQEDLYTEANRVLYYDNFSAPGLAQLHQLKEARTGSYVGFKVTNGVYTICRLGELGVYGTPANVTQITADNKDQIPVGNYLATASKLSGSLASGSHTIDKVSDGLIPTVNTDVNEKVGFSVNASAVPTAPNGVPATMAAGVASVAFQLAQKTTITKLLVAGSPEDGASLEGGKYDNRHVRYYEVYVSDSYDTLFNAANRVLYYDNFSMPGIAQLHELSTPAQGTYVGYKLSGGQHGQARTAELGVYGYSPDVTQVTSANADKIPAINRLSSAVIKAGEPGDDAANAVDGVINGINSSESVKASFSVTEYTGEAPVPVTLPNGQTVAKTSGLAKVAYQLTNIVAIEQLLVAGSANDETSQVQGGVTYDNRHVLYYEVYISEDYSTLFAPESRVVMYDNSINPGLAQLHKLEEPVQGRYVGFMLSAGAWELARVAELGVYGSVPGVTQITQSNAGRIPANNLLTDATRKNGYLAGGSKPIEKLSDGLIYGINSEVNEAVGFGLNSFEEAKANNGASVPKTSGMGRVSFDLMQPCFISNILVAGSAGDDTDFSDNGPKDNRHVRYYEIYVSNDFDTLYDAANLVLTYDNFTDPQLAQMFAVDLRGRYVGFKMTAGAYESVRLSELGVYGSAVRTTVLTSENADTKIPSGNLLASAVSKPWVDTNQYNMEYLYDGLIGGVNADDSNKVGFSGTNGTVTSVNGTTVENVSGLATLTFQLAGRVTFDKVIFAGSHSDSMYSWNSISCDNRHIRYLEMYVGDEESTLYSETNRKLVYENFPVNQLAMLLEMAQPATGRYVGFKLSTGSHSQVRVAELGVYGVPQNLVAGRLPAETFEIPARGIDNKTAITDAEGTAGTGNTGALNGRVSIWKTEPLANLTDGDIDTRGALSQSTAPSVKGLDSSVSQGLYYDTPWSVLTYYLGGLTTVEEITVSSGVGADHYLSGLQYYASDSYDTLFTNESLLYTSGGEYYTLDEENNRIPDVEYEINQNRQTTYKLTAAQRAKTYRYVAVVITRPYGLYQPGSSSKLLVGYCQARISELNVTGTLVADGRDFYTATSSVGEITMQVAHLSNNDHLFFENTLGGFTVTESTLSASVNRYTAENWMMADGDTVFTIQLIDKFGNAIPETGDSIMAVNGREVEFSFPSTADHVQTMGVLEDDTLRRLLNSFPDKETRRINAGALDYPVYTEWTDNDGGTHLPSDNRHEAILAGGQFSLVYLRAVDAATANRLNNIPVTDNLLEFMNVGVNGVSATSSRVPAMPVWLWVLLGTALVASAGATAVCVRRRARRVAPVQQ